MPFTELANYNAGKCLRCRRDPVYCLAMGSGFIASRMTNRLARDQTALKEQSDLGLHCLPKYIRTLWLIDILEVLHLCFYSKFREK